VTQQRKREILGAFVSGLRRYVVAATWVYYTLLFSWAVGFLVTGDRYPVLMVLNIAALYLFLPIPLALIVAILIPRRELWIGAGTSILLFLAMWGQLFLPRTRAEEANVPTLTVMNYNVRGYNQDASASVELIRRVDADVVIMQEVNHKLAEALAEELREAYPYQVLDPYDDVRGMGSISKLPLQVADGNLPLEWVGTPQILALEWEGEKVTLVNFHMWAVGLGPMRYMEINARAREAHALYLVDFANGAAQEGPVIVAGDANATPQSDTYRIMARWLEDSWTEAGTGFGHTFPGSPGSESPVIYGIPLPRWLFRIDYVFHSPDLEAVDAFMAPFDGVSDHRGVVVTLSLGE